MLKDIPNKKVKDVAIAIIPKNSEDEMWDVYLLNLKGDSINNVLINSHGYGEVEGEQRETTRLRHFYENITAETAVLIEPIQPEVIKFTNEYWISFSFKDHLYDKKYVFVRGSISDELLTDVPIVDKKGIMIK